VPSVFSWSVRCQPADRLRLWGLASSLADLIFPCSFDAFYSFTVVGSPQVSIIFRLFVLFPGHATAGLFPSVRPRFPLAFPGFFPNRQRAVAPLETRLFFFSPSYLRALCFAFRGQPVRRHRSHFIASSPFPAPELVGFVLCFIPHFFSFGRG